MNHRLDATGTALAVQLAAPRPQTLMTEAKNLPVFAWITWTQTAHEQSAAMRRKRIAVVAYHMSEARGFAPGHDQEDWLLAQRRVSASDAAIFES